MKNKKPLVSICIPTYNSEKFLAATLDTIAAQTYTHIEVIIGDNASSDSTPSIIRTYANKNSWRYYVNECNIGAIENFNKLINSAQGDYIAIYHADDLYSPKIVEESVKAFETNPNIGIVSTLGCEVDENGTKIREIGLPKVLLNRNTMELTFQDVFEGILKQDSVFLVTPSVMVSTAAYRMSGNFDGKNYKSAADYEMWFRILQNYQMSILKMPLIKYRIHEGQGSHHEIRLNLKKPDSLLVYEHYITFCPPLFKDFKYCYSKLIFITSLKLNNAGEFHDSNIILKQTMTKNAFYFFLHISLIACNRLKIKLSLQKLLQAKAVLKKVKEPCKN